MSELEFAKEVVKLVGGFPNIIVVFNCYTRIRINIRDIKKVDVEAIKKLEKVIGVVVSGIQIQIIVGPGKSAKLAQVINQTLEANIYLQQQEETIEATAKLSKEKEAASDKEYLDNKKSFRGNLNGGFNAVMKKIAGIFVPIIPAFIACGLLLAILEIVKNVNAADPEFIKTTPIVIFNVISSSVFSVLSIVVGYNACKEFGGDGILGACLAGILTSPLLGSIEEPILAFGPIKIYASLGGIISVLFVAIAAAYFEKLIRKFMPNIIDAFLTPLITLAVMSMAGLFIFMPIGGFIALGIEKAVTAITGAVPFLLGLIPMFYLLMVLFGVHHALIPISQHLINASTVYGPDGKTIITPGWSIIVPIQLMAGAAEVGAAIYFLMTSKNKKMKKNVVQALPIGVLGIDEPLIWGMTFSLRRLFIPIGIAGGVVGAVLAVLLSNFKCGSIVPETTGIEATLLISNTPGKIAYAVAFVVAIILGFVVTALIGYKETYEVKNEKGEIVEATHETSLALKYYNIYREKHPRKIDKSHD